MRVLLPRPLLLIAWLLLAVAPFPAAAEKEKRKDTPKLPIPPPQPVPQEITVKRGETVDIQLKIYGRKNENLKYLVRTRPDFGKLTEPRVLSQETSEVTYRSPVNLQVKRDHFSYAVQNSNGVSAPSEVNITIFDDAPLLVVPELLDFGALLAGRVTMKELEIANRGGSLSVGEVQVPPPFRVEGPAQYRLGAGDRQKFLIIFEPRERGTFRGEIRYTSQLDHATSLRAVGEPAIDPQPAELLLQHLPASTQRIGRLEFANNTDEAQLLTLRAGDRLHVPPTLSVPAHEKRALEVSLEESDTAPLEESLAVEGAGIQLRVPVRAAATGPVLRLGQTTVRFPTVLRSQPTSTTLVIQNIGGQEGFWKWQVPAPFSVEPESARLPASGSQTLRISVAAHNAGSFRGILRIEGELQAQEAQVEAEVVNSLAAPPPAAVSRRPPGEREGRAAIAEKAAAAAADSRIAALLYLKENVNVTHIQAGSATVEWPAALTTAKTCRIEIRTLHLGENGRLQEDWHVPANLKLNRVGDRYFAELGSLRPASLQTVRVLPVVEEGEIATPLFQTQFQTIPPKEPPVRITGFRVAIVLLVALAAGAYARRRVSRSREEAELNAGAKERFGLGG